MADSFWKTFSKKADETLDGIAVYFYYRFTRKWKRRQVWADRLERDPPQMVDSLYVDDNRQFGPMGYALQLWMTDANRPKILGAPSERTIESTTYKGRRGVKEGKVIFLECLPPTVMEWFGMSEAAEHKVRSLILSQVPFEDLVKAVRKIR